MQKFIWFSLVSFICGEAFATNTIASNSISTTKAVSSQTTVKKPAASAPPKQGLPDNILRAMQNSQADAAAQAKDFAKSNPQ